MNPFSDRPREALLEAAAAVLAEEGPEGLNIRRVAARCGVSVGTVYNFFRDKEELTLAVVEQFWKGLFTSMPGPGGGGRPDLVRHIHIIYQGLWESLRPLGPKRIRALLPDDRQGSATPLSRRPPFDQVTKGLEQLLLADPDISTETWNQVMNPARAAEWIFDNLLLSLLRGEESPEFVIAVLESALYRRSTQAGVKKQENKEE